MKHIFVLLVSAFIFEEAFGQAKPPETPTAPPPLIPKEECPPKDKIPGCTCYTTTRRMICGEITQKFDLPFNYSIKTLSFENTPSLTKFADKTIPTNRLHVESLIIIQNADSGSKIPKMQILEDVLSISTKSIKIMSSSTSVPTDTLDVGSLSSDITALVIQGVPKMTNFDPAKFPKLTRLQIIDTQLDSASELFFSNSPIKYLEFRNTNIDGSFSYIPVSCKKDEQITIKLRNNKLNNFDFTTLFPMSAITDADKTKLDCNYHIDLSENTKLLPELLTKQIDSISLFYNNKDPKKQNLYLVIKSGPKFACNCPIFKTYSLNKDYIHGINCITDKSSKPVDKPLDDLGEADFQITPCKATL